MPTGSQKYVVFLTFPVILLLAGCGSAGPASPTALDAGEPGLIRAEAAAATPEFLPLAFCPARPAFRLRVAVAVSGGLDLFVRLLRVDFTDRFGAQTFPEVIPIPDTLGSIPTSMPVPFPGSPALPGSHTIPMPSSAPIPMSSGSPVSVPGFSPFASIRISVGRPRTIPLFLQFGCGVPASGTLVVSLETTDSRGRTGTSRIRFLVGG